MQKRKIISKMQESGSLLLGLTIRAGRRVRDLTRSYGYVEKSRAKLFERNNLLLREYSEAEEVYIMATGPSVAKVSLDFLQGKTVFTVSNAFLHDKISLIEPTLHLFAKYHPPMTFDSYLDYIRSADEMLPKSCRIFFPADDRWVLEKFDIFNQRDVFFYGVCRRKYSDIRCDRYFPIYQTIPQLALMLALAFKIKKVRLIGCDHNILLNYGKKEEHFFASNQDKRKLPGGASRHLSFTELLKTQYHVFDIYEQLVKGGKSTEITLATPNSWLENIGIEYISVGDGS